MEERKRGCPFPLREKKRGKKWQGKDAFCGEGRPTWDEKKEGENTKKEK